MAKVLTKGSPAKLIFLFSLPLIAGNLFQQFYSMADTLIVGRTLGVNALAAVGCTGSSTFLMLGFVTGATSGLSVVTSQEFGAGREERVKKSFAASIWISICMALIFTILAVALVHPLLKLLQTPEEVIADAEKYLRIIFLGIPVTILFNLLSNIIRALGDSRTPLYFLILASVVNIILDFVLILGGKMGVEGAALATVIAQLFSSVCCIFLIWKKMPILWIKKEDFKMPWGYLQRYLNLALPMGFQSSIIAIGSLILQYALNGFGTTAVAAYTAAQKIDSIATMPMCSFGNAMATYVGQNYGAKQFERIKKGVNQCILMSGSFSIIMGIINVTQGSKLAMLFVGEGESEVIKLSQVFLSISGSLYLALALLFIYRSSLQGMGNSFFPMCSGFIELAMRAIGALVLSKVLGFAGACLSSPLAWVGAAIPLAIVYYRTINKQKGQEKEIDNTECLMIKCINKNSGEGVADAVWRSKSTH